MTPTQALGEISRIVELGLSPRPLSGTWQSLLNIQKVLQQVDAGDALTGEERAHLAAIVPVVGSTAVDIEVLDWFEAHGDSLAAKLDSTP